MRLRWIGNPDLGYGFYVTHRNWMVISLNVRPFFFGVRLGSRWWKLHRNRREGIGSMTFSERYGYEKTWSFLGLRLSARDMKHEAKQ